MGLQCVIINDNNLAEIASDWNSVEKLGNEFVEDPVRSTLFDVEVIIE